jgi:hypothetical protein
VPLLTRPLGFDGQSISSPFYGDFKACVEKFKGLGDKYAESKHLGPKELWGRAPSGGGSRPRCSEPGSWRQSASCHPRSSTRSSGWRRSGSGSVKSLGV